MPAAADDERRELPITFIDILSEMNQEGDFQRSVLATEEGLPIAAAPDQGDHDSAGALLSMLRRVSEEIQEQLEITGIDEVTIRDRERSRLVCRAIDSGSETLILAAFVPPGRYYRRATNRAIKRIQQLIQG